MRYDLDADDEREAQLLASDPQGSFLLKSRILWLVSAHYGPDHVLGFIAAAALPCHWLFVMRVFAINMS